ncbi:OmpA-like domain [Flavobacteriaceae bacterium]
MKDFTASRISIGLFLFCLGITSLSAQEIVPEIALDSIKTEIAMDSTIDSETELNKWSFEFGFGSNKAVRPFGTGYNSSGGEFLSSSTLNHFDFGFRYMLNSHFGLKSDIGFDVISNKLGNGSLPFRSMQYRLGLQGVFDLGKVFKFETFSNTIGLLGHGGFQLSQFKSKTGIGNQEAVVDAYSGFLIGLSPQIKLSERTVLTLDFTFISNVGQNLNWDGSTSAQENNLTGLLYNTSIGLTFYLGKNQKHSDWFIPKIIPEVDPEVNRRLDEIETLLNDTDKDGVVDYLDVQNNTPSGVIVDSKGRYIDTNRNGTPDEFEPNTIEDIKVRNFEIASEQSETNAFKSMLDNGLVNVFYDVNEVEPNRGSANSVYGIISLLKKNPTVNVKLLGYSDKSGNEKLNKKLSEQRVKNLYDLLLLSGISESRLKIIGQGVDSSIPSNSKTAYQIARRVSVILD